MNFHWTHQLLTKHLRSPLLMVAPPPCLCSPVTLPRPPGREDLWCAPHRGSPLWHRPPPVTLRQPRGASLSRPVSDSRLPPARPPLCVLLGVSGVVFLADETFCYAVILAHFRSLCALCSSYRHQITAPRLPLLLNSFQDNPLTKKTPHAGIRCPFQRVSHLFLPFLFGKI